MSDLRDDLMDLQGVGEATADKVLDLIDEHDAAGNDDAQEAIGEALAYLAAGRPGYAEKFLRRVADGGE